MSKLEIYVYSNDNKEEIEEIYEVTRAEIVNKKIEKIFQINGRRYEIAENGKIIHNQEIEPSEHDKELRKHDKNMNKRHSTKHPKRSHISTDHSSCNLDPRIKRAVKKGKMVCPACGKPWRYRK